MLQSSLRPRKLACRSYSAAAAEESVRSIQGLLNERLRQQSARSIGLSTSSAVTPFHALCTACTATERGPHCKRVRPATVLGREFVGGGDGIRTHDTVLRPYNGLANRRLQPLGHPSAWSGVNTAYAGPLLKGALATVKRNSSRYMKIASQALDISSRRYVMATRCCARRKGLDALRSGECRRTVLPQPIVYPSIWFGFISCPIFFLNFYVLLRDFL